MKSKLKTRKKHGDLYTHIDWKKARLLFVPQPKERVSLLKHTGYMLRVLASVADKGMIFLTHPDDPAIVEYVINGTGPLTWQTSTMIHRFQKQKYVSIKENAKGNITVKLTKCGMTRALSYQLDTMTVKKPKHWDKKWRVVMFDVPDKYKKLRDVFRMRLKQLGLYQLQESAYVSPYSCFDEIEFLRELYGIAFTVQYLLVDSIEHDESLQRRFFLL